MNDLRRSHRGGPGCEPPVHGAHLGIHMFERIFLLLHPSFLEGTCGWKGPVHELDVHLETQQ